MFVIIIIIIKLYQSQHLHSATGVGLKVTIYRVSQE